MTLGVRTQESQGRAGWVRVGFSIHWESRSHVKATSLLDRQERERERREGEGKKVWSFPARGGLPLYHASPNPLKRLEGPTWARGLCGPRWMEFRPLYVPHIRETIPRGLSALTYLLIWGWQHCPCPVWNVKDMSSPSLLEQCPRSFWALSVKILVILKSNRF